MESQQAYGYVRISDDREGKELGVQRQEEDIRALAARLGVNLAHVFCDNDITAAPGSKKHRADYHDLMKRLERGPVRIVLAYTTSRLTRDPIESELQVRLAKTKSVQYHYVAGQSLDLKHSANRKMARIQAAFDAGEAEDIQERTQRQKLQDAQAGRWNGGTRTYGYGLKAGVNPLTGEDILDYDALVPGEVAILAECKARIINGESQQEIVRDLNARKIPTAKGGLWTVGKLKRTLLYRRYVISRDGRGTRVHHDTEYPAVWPGVFTEAEHQALKAIFDKTAQKWSHGPVKGRTYLLTGLTRCGACGGAMYGRNKIEKGVKLRRYHCKKEDNHGVRVGCGRVYRIADPLEYLVSEAVLYRFDNPEVAKALAPHEDEGRVTELTDQLAQLARRLDDLADEHAISPLPNYRRIVGRIEAEMETIKVELARLRTDKAKALLLPTDGGLRDMWEPASMQWRHAVIRLLVDKIVVNPGLPGGKMFKQWRFDVDTVDISWIV